MSSHGRPKNVQSRNFVMASFILSLTSFVFLSVKGKNSRDTTGIALKSRRLTTMHNYNTILLWFHLFYHSLCRTGVYLAGLPPGFS